MLTPEYLAGCTDYLLGMYDALQTSLAEDIARRIIKTGTLTDTAAYQLKRSQAAGALLQDTAEKVASMTGLTNEEISRLFTDAGITSMQNDTQPLLKAGYDIDLRLSSSMSAQLEAAITKTQGDMFNLTMTTGSTVTNQYLEATNKAYMMVTSGGYSYSEAIASAIKDCACEGGFVNYASGARSRIDVAVRRSVLTGVNQTAAKMTEAYSQDLGAEYYETSAHLGARPTHEEWQGQVFKINGSEKGYPNFEQATGYGTGDGICGWNCRHSFYPYWPGISERAYSKEKLAEYANTSYEYQGNTYSEYECSQIQRAYERDIRASKRVLASYNAAIKAATPGSITASVLEANYKEESVNLKSIESAMKDFCSATNRKTDSVRTRVVATLDGNGRIVGFSHSESSKAVWANKKSGN